MPAPFSSPAAQLAERILRAAQKAASEEDLKIAVESALEKALATLGVQSTPEYEKTILSGSADAVYGHVVIEYERPGKLAKDAGRAETVGQLTRYLLGQTAKHGARQAEALGKMIGVSLDGRQILFVRHTTTERGREFSLPGLPGGQLTLFEEKGVAGRFQILGPYPVNEDSIGVFLLYLRSLARKPLTPEALARDFGPGGDVAAALVGALHAALKAHLDSSSVATFYGEWDRLFGIVYGEELGKAESDAKELAKLYRIGGRAELKPLLFTVHTYYALLMKFLAVELISLQGGMLVTSFASDLPALGEAEVKTRLANLGDGGLFNKLGIANFLEGDFFRWYLSVWSRELAAAIRQFAGTLAQFEPATSTLEPESTRDLLKKLYQYLIPKSLRHDLGEYYTPDWLAERLLNQLGYDGDPQARLIDPSCGSGTFIVLALKRLRQRGAEAMLTAKQIAESALKNIVGFDLNPLAVIAARTNYLLALGDLIRHTRPVEIPIYMCDSILTPTESSGQLELFASGYTIHSTVGDFKIPAETVKAREMDRLAALLEEAVRGEYSARDFAARARRELTLTQPAAESAVKELFVMMADLHKRKRDGLWARLIKNAFAPIFVGQFDFVAGNPPWINWESLSQEYREATKKLWSDYGLFSLKGHAARLGGGKKDLSMLFTYAAADHYLRPGGKLGFVITQTVFQTKGAGAGFRRFQLGEGDSLGVQSVDDMVDLQPFEGASNWTAVVTLKRGAITRYPIPYTLWKRKEGGRIGLDWTLDEVTQATTRSNFSASPVDENDPASPWMTGRGKTTKALAKAKGKAAYKARAGVCTWADGVYWLRVLDKRPDGLLVVENLAESGKRVLPTVQAEIEPDLLYPFIEWKEIGRFSARSTHYILMAQDPEKRKGYDESWMKTELPKTYAYLLKFRDLLRKRSGYVKYFDKSDPFYSMYNVGVENFAPFRVVWKSMGTDIEPAVLSTVSDQWVGQRLPMHKNTVSFVATDDEAEAHYLCAVLSSSVVNALAKSSSVKGGKSFGNTNLLHTVAIPAYDSTSSLHRRLAELSQRAHALAPNSPAPVRGSPKGRGESGLPLPAGEGRGEGELAGIEREIDEAAAELWGLSAAELEEIRRSAEEG